MFAHSSSQLQVLKFHWRLRIRCLPHSTKIACRGQIDEEEDINVNLWVESACKLNNFYRSTDTDLMEIPDWKHVLRGMNFLSVELLRTSTSDPGSDIIECSICVLCHAQYEQNVHILNRKYIRAYMNGIATVTTTWRIIWSEIKSYSCKRIIFNLKICCCGIYVTNKLNVKYLLLFIFYFILRSASSPAIASAAETSWMILTTCFNTHAGKQI